MARIVFTQQLRRFTQAPEVITDATSLRDALEVAFTGTPNLRGYVLDDQGHLRKHVIVFIDGRRVRDYARLDDALTTDSQVHVLQALTGG